MPDRFRSTPTWDHTAASLQSAGKGWKHDPRCWSVNSCDSSNMAPAVTSLRSCAMGSLAGKVMSCAADRKIVLCIIQFQLYKYR